MSSSVSFLLTAAALAGAFLLTVNLVSGARRRHRPKGLAWIAAGIAFCAFIRLSVNLVGYGQYQLLLSHLPDWLLPLRYTVSMTLRLAFLAAAAGLLLLKERYRRFAVGLWAFNLAVVYWKHPYPAAEKAIAVGRHLLAGHVEASRLAWPYHAPTAYAMVLLFDVGFSALILFYLTRPWVRERFD